MHSLDMIRGFEELKDLLVKTYKISRPRNEVMLYFRADGIEISLHDFDDHKKVITVCFDVSVKKLNPALGPLAKIVVLESLTDSDPAKFLNSEFKLNGFYLS